MNRSTKEFAEKLYEILETQDNKGSVRWNDDGMSFLLLDTVEFAESVLVLYFKHKNLNSFVRQLNKYDFHKVKSLPETIEKYGSNIWEFKHIYFQKDRKDLLCKIRRKRSVSERRNDYSSLENDIAEKSIFLQNQMLSSLITLSKHFQMVSNDIVELKKLILNEKSKPEYSGKAVLIYEENPSLRMLSKSFLDRIGFSIYIAESNSDLFKFVKEKRFDIILISMTLKNITMIVSEIRRVDINAIIILTALSISKADYIKYHKLGVDEFILKPYSEENFKPLLEKYNFIKDDTSFSENPIDTRNLKYF